MKWITIAALAGTAVLCAGAAGAQGVDFSKVEIKTTDLGNKTYMLEGQGGNMTVAVGTDGIIMVDTEFAPLHDKIKAAIEKISPLPVKYVINTHYHGDHTGGNAAFHKDGATIVAQDNIRVRLAAGTTNGLTGSKMPPAAGGRAPDRDLLSAARRRSKSAAARRMLTHVEQRPHRRRHLGLFSPTPTCSRTGDTFNNTNLSQHRLRQWRRHRRHDPRRRNVPQAGQRQDQDRAGPRSARHQGRPPGIPRHAGRRRATGSRSCYEEGKSEQKCSRPSRWPTSTKKWAVCSGSRDRGHLHCATSITRSAITTDRHAHGIAGGGKPARRLHMRPGWAGRSMSATGCRREAPALRGVVFQKMKAAAPPGSAAARREVRPGPHRFSQRSH